MGAIKSCAVCPFPGPKKSILLGMQSYAVVKVKTAGLCRMKLPPWALPGEARRPPWLCSVVPGGNDPVIGIDDHRPYPLS